MLGSRMLATVVAARLLYFCMFTIHLEDHFVRAQELILDWYVRMEAGNLNWLRRNQAAIRAELYGGLADAVHAGDTDASKLGRRTILPASFTGSPRNVSQNYQVIIIKWHLFAFACNRAWLLNVHK